jgi:ParB/RepB/Spo0J family partition protein
MTPIAKMDALTMPYCRNIEVADIELTHLDLRYSHTRIHHPGIISSLADSIERCGQISPVITLKQGDSAFVLLDGYLRIAALKRCGKDTVLAQVWRHFKESEALIMVIAKNQGRRWELVEQACLIRELQDRHNLSQEKIASMLGRNKSWVSRRISLVSALPEQILSWVLSGHISTWAATRVLVPLARANKAHANALAKDLVKEYISTRDLTTFFQHYQKANRNKRELMVKHPAMFIKALHCREEENQADFLKQGPEGRWLKDLKMSGHVFRRLIKQVSTVIYQGQSRLDRRTLLTAFEDVKKLMLSLERKIMRFANEDNTGEETSRCDDASAGHQDPKYQSDTQDFQKQCSSNPAGTNNGCDVQKVPLRADNADHSGAIQTLQG